MNEFKFSTFTENELRAIIRSEMLNVLNEQTPKLPENEFKSDFLTVDEVAVVLHLAPVSIYGLVFHKKIPFLKRGKRLYFERAKIDQWMREGKRNSQSETEQLAEEYLRKTDQQ